MRKVEYKDINVFSYNRNNCQHKNNSLTYSEGTYLQEVEEP